MRASLCQIWSTACRLEKYKDLKLACTRHGCEQVLCVPILPQLPDGHALAAQPSPPQSAFGVLMLGFDSSVLVDARCVTALHSLTTAA